MLRNRIFTTMFAAILTMALLAGQAIIAPQPLIVHAQAAPAIDFDTIAYVPMFLRAVITQTIAGQTNLPNDDLFYSSSFRFSDLGDEARIVLVPAYVVDAGWVNLVPSDLVEIWLRHQSGGEWTVQPTPEQGEASSGYRFPWTSGDTWYKNGGFHQGLAIDFQPQSSNTSVLAASNGTLEVTCARDVDGQTWLSVGSAIYAHLDADSVPTNLIGKQVQRGQKIGELFADLPSSPKPKSCGYGFGAHLHFIFPNTSITMYDVIEARDIPASEMGVDTGIGAVSYTSNNVPATTPSGFSKISPSNNSEVEAPNVTIQWNAPNPAPDWYRVCLKAGEPCNGNADGVWINHSTTSFTRTDLLPNTTYYWDIQAKYSSGTTIPSDDGWWSFTTISAGFTISGNVGIGGATMRYVDGSPRSVVADGNGNYSITVPNGWSGIVTPTKTGVTFVPPTKSYNDLADNVSGENYTALLKISGNAGPADVTLSYNNNGPQTVTTNSNGNYVIPNLPVGWSGTVTPSLAGYTFSPPSRPYSNLPTTKSNQGYTAQVQISGNIGIGSGLVNLKTCTPTCTTLPTYTTGADGIYSFQVAYRSTGTVTPQKACYIFSPPSQNYPSVTANTVLPAFTATLNRYTISGNTGSAGVTLSYTDGTPKTVTSDASGNYTIPNLPCGWSGAVTPSKPGFTFYPANKTYTNLQANTTGQIFYTKVTISGNMGVTGAPAGSVKYTLDLMEMAGFVSPDAQGNYSFTVSTDHDVTVWAIVDGYIFSPASQSFQNLDGNKELNFTATPVISGRSGAAGATLSYTENGIPKTATTNAGGYYSFGITPGWSGTVAISKPGVTFSVASHTYSNVTTPQSEKNYPVLVTYKSSAAYDGWVLESTQTSQLGGSIDNSANVFRVGDDASKRQYRSILSFGTGSLPNSAVIQSAVLRIKQNGAPVGANPFTALGSLRADVREGSFGTAGLQVTDFEAVASGNAVATFNETPVDLWYSATLNAAGRGFINAVSGVTQFRLRFSDPDNNNATADYMKFLSGDFTSDQPELIITYTLP